MNGGKRQVDGTSEPKPKRFKALADDEIDSTEGKPKSTSTKKNSQWGINLFQERHKEVFEHELDFYTVTKDNLAEKLRKFYCEANPKQNGHREKVLPAHQANEYHRNTMTNIKCDKSDIDRNVDIVRDPEFTKSNRTFDGHLKSRMESGTSRPTQHKEISQVTTCFNGITESL
ncbi:hypothetical protein MAR_016548 [Mya arenaria]|uniref:Uncharacterized protein n=1 Tax=Mya arenaria TaxID=6604 RepID=A0ABY7FMN2_MYAAR|nr:hypothetical protein MAR_016548 [Mya arenaria]